MTTEEEIVAGTLSVTKGGQGVSLPVLKIRPAREWRAQVMTALNGQEPGENPAIEISEQLVELVAAYDRENRLGGREAIEDGMTDQELYDAFLEMWRKSFPFARLTKDLIGLAI